MEMPIDDFDPITDRVDINDEEYESLIPNDNVDPQGIFDKLRHTFGDRARSAFKKLQEKWKSRNPNKDVPEYLQMEEFDNMERNETIADIVTTPVDRAKQRLSELYEHFSFDDVKLSYKGEIAYIQVETTQRGKSGWTKPLVLFTSDGEVTAQVARLKGFEIASKGLLERLKEHRDRVEALKRAESLEKEMQEKDKEYQERDKEYQEKDKDYKKQYKMLIDGHVREKDDIFESFNKRLDGTRQQLAEMRQKLADTTREKDATARAFDLALKEAGISREQVGQLETIIDGAIAEKGELENQLRTLEEKLRQTTQALEDSEGHIVELRQIINDPARVEDHAQAETDLEELQGRVEELQKMKDNLENELGLTTKEKIKRLLLKYGVPLAFAVAISTVVGVIVTSLKGVGSGVKKLGAGLTNLGKKMAASIPGLLGTALSFALKTGGELLKFVGNNIWILVVAIGMVLLKKLK